MEGKGDYYTLDSVATAGDSWISQVKRAGVTIILLTVWLPQETIV